MNNVENNDQLCVAYSEDDVDGYVRVTRDKERLPTGALSEIRLSRCGGWVVERTM